MSRSHVEGLMPHLASIAYKPADREHRPKHRYSRAAVERAERVAGHGMDGDVKAGPGDRQLNVMLAEAVEKLLAEGFHTAPGELGEQLVIAGLPEEAATAGVRLRV